MILIVSDFIGKESKKSQGHTARSGRIGTQNSGLNDSIF